MNLKWDGKKCKYLDKKVPKAGRRSGWFWWCLIIIVIIAGIIALLKIDF